MYTSVRTCPRLLIVAMLIVCETKEMDRFSGKVFSIRLNDSEIEIISIQLGLISESILRCHLYKFRRNGKKLLKGNLCRVDEV